MIHWALVGKRWGLFNMVSYVQGAGELLQGPRIPSSLCDLETLSWEFTGTVLSFQPPLKDQVARSSEVECVTSSSWRGLPVV